MTTEIQEFEFTSVHLQMIRAMVVSWDREKAGAPTIEPTMPYGHLDTIGCLANMIDRDPKYLAVEDEMELQNLHRQSEVAFEIFLTQGRLKSGLHHYEDHLAVRHLLLSETTTDIRTRPDMGRHLDNLPTDRAMRFLHIFKNLHAEKNSQKKLLKEKENPSPISTFLVLEEHLKLLRNLAVRWRRPEKSLFLSDSGVVEETENQNVCWPVVGIDPKKPYGESTDHFSEMEKILGASHKNSHSDGKQDLLKKLHTDMQTVLQIFVQKADMISGSYCNTESGWVFEDARQPHRNHAEGIIGS